MTSIETTNATAASPWEGTLVAPENDRRERKEMGGLKVPTETAGWKHMAPGQVKAEIALAGMKDIDLQAASRRFGIEQNTSNISAKLTKGRFWAVPMLQAPVAIRVEDIRLPRAYQAPSP